MPKFRQVDFPALSFDAWLMLKDLAEQSGVDIDQLTITGGSRTKELNDSLPNSAKDSRHLHGDGIDFGGKYPNGEDAENKKLFEWLNGKSDEAKQFKDEWGLKIIGSYGDKHLHLGVTDGADSKGDRIKALYAQYEPIWNQNYGANGMIDMTKMPSDAWSGSPANSLKPEYQSDYYVNGDKGITTDRNSAETRGETVEETKVEDSKPWGELGDEEKKKLWPKYNELQNRLSEVDDPATRKNIISQYPELQGYGDQGYQEFRKHVKDERTREFREQYGIEDVQGRKDQITELEGQLQGLVGEGDADQRREIEQQIKALEAENESDYLRAEREMYQDKLDVLQARVDKGETLDGKDFEEYKKLRKKLPNEKDRKALYSELAESVGVGTDEAGVRLVLKKVLESGMHPQVWKETQSEFSKLYYEEHRKNSNVNQSADNSLNSWRKVNDAISGTIGKMVYGTDVNVPGTFSFSSLVNMIAPEWAAKQRDEDARYLHARDNAKDAETGDFMWEEGMTEEYIAFKKQMDAIKAGNEIREGVIDIPKNIIGGDEWAPVTPSSEDETNETDETDETDETTTDDGKKDTGLEGVMSEGWKYNPEEADWFDKMGGAEGMMGLAQGAAGLIGAKRVNVPEPEILDKMLVSHIATIERLSKSGMDPVQEAAVREGLDSGFHLAKKAIMDVASGSRGQALAGIGSLSADRQKQLLNLEEKKSQNRQTYMKMYGDLMKYANDFSAQQENLNNQRQFDLSKMRSEGNALMAATGIDQLITAINTAKEYGPNSIHDITKQYTLDRLQIGAEDEESFRGTLKNESEQAPEKPTAESATVQFMEKDAIKQSKQQEQEIQNIEDRYPMVPLEDQEIMDEVDQFNVGLYSDKA